MAGMIGGLKKTEVDKADLIIEAIKGLRKEVVGIKYVVDIGLGELWT